MSKGLVIFDSGHARNTAGKCAPDKSFHEWEFNNDMQYRLEKRCRDHDLKVGLTNPNPATVSDVPLSTRAATANRIHKDNPNLKAIMLSLHANAFKSVFNEARGVEVYYASNASQNSKNLSKYLCDQIYADVKSIDPGFKNRGTKCEDFTVIHKTITPTCLIEYGFYTNISDLKVLKANRSLLVEATMKAICRYFGIAYKPPVNHNTSPSGKQVYYRVVTGSYLNKAEAEKERDELKAKGYPGTFLVAFEK